MPEAVIRLSIEPAKRDGADKLAKALERFRREDPTFRVFTDEETGQTIIAGACGLEVFGSVIRLLGPRFFHEIDSLASGHDERAVLPPDADKRGPPRMGLQSDRDVHRRLRNIAI